MFMGFPIMDNFSAVVFAAGIKIHKIKIGPFSDRNYLNFIIEDFKKQMSSIKVWVPFKFDMNGSKVIHNSVK